MPEGHSDGAQTLLPHLFLVNRGKWLQSSPFLLVPPKFPLAHLSSLRHHPAHKPTDHPLSTKPSSETSGPYLFYGTRSWLEMEEGCCLFFIHVTQGPGPQPALGQETKKRRTWCGAKIQLPGPDASSWGDPLHLYHEHGRHQGEKIKSCTNISAYVLEVF